MRAALSLLCAALALTLAVAGAPPTAVGAQEEGAATRIPLAEFTPLPAADEVEVSAEAQALREELLGPHSLDPRYVTLHWFGVAGFVMTIRGHVVLLDSWEIIGANNDYAPIGREELAGLEPEAIMLGHGHFDHGGDAGYVAGRTGAVVVGSEGICNNAEGDAAAEGNEVTCLITGTEDTPSPGTAQTVQLFADVEPITILQHLHSAATPPGEGNEPDPELPIFDPQPYIEHLSDDPEELERFLRQQEHEQGGTWMYHFAVDDFTLLWGDSSGPLFTDPAVGEALGAMPGCVDVLSNAILGFDQPVSGLQDPRLYVEAVQPKYYLPQHGDAWAPVLSAGQAQYVPVWREENVELGIRQPATDWLLDPQDYMVEQAFDTADPIWSDHTPGSRCAVQRIDRRWGPDRFHTAARLSQARFAPGVGEVWLVDGGEFTDAAVAVPAAAVGEAPVLPVTDDGIQPVVLEEIQRLLPDSIIIVGETLSEQVEADLAEAGIAVGVSRLGSGDAYQRAAEISQARFDAATEVFLTTGERFPDALAAGPAAVATTSPLLLTRPDELPEATADELERLSSVLGQPAPQVMIVGGTAAVSQAVSDAVAEITGQAPMRVAGDDRFATAAAVSGMARFEAAPVAYVANGETFPDAIFAGAPAGVDGAPILLVGLDRLPQVSAEALGAVASAAWAVVAGGDAVISPTIRQSVSDALPVAG